MLCCQKHDVICSSTGNSPNLYDFVGIANVSSLRLKEFEELHVVHTYIFIDHSPNGAFQGQ